MFLHQYSLATIAVAMLFATVTQPLAAQTIESYIDNDWPDERYTHHGDGTVTDNATGLMWQRCAVGQSGNDCATGSASRFYWFNALREAANSTHAGFSDWRLPNITELNSLVAGDRYYPAINIDAFPNTPSSSFWSSSPSFWSASSSQDYALVVDFRVGGTDSKNLSDRYSNNNNNHVRLVRSGQ